MSISQYTRSDYEMSENAMKWYRKDIIHYRKTLYIYIMPYNISLGGILDIENIPTVPTDLDKIFTKFPNCKKDLTCSVEDIQNLQKYSKNITQKLNELEYIVNLPDDCFSNSFMKPNDDAIKQFESIKPIIEKILTYAYSCSAMTSVFENLSGESDRMIDNYNKQKPSLNKCNIPPPPTITNPTMKNLAINPRPNSAMNKPKNNSALIPGLPGIPSNISNILSSIPGIPKDIVCSESDIEGIQKYSELLLIQIKNINHLMNLPSDCTLINIPALMDFMKRNPNFKLPTIDEISSDLSNISSCSEVNTFLKTKSDQLATLLTIITESKKCKDSSAIDSSAKEVSAIDYQTESIQNKIPDLDGQTNTYAEKTKYQTDMYVSVKYVNDLLLIFYAVLFSVIHILLFVQYVQGVNRDATKDTIWLTVLFLYPYLIYYVEKTIYSGIMYFLSLIYGTTYVYQFDKILLFTDFYSDPGKSTENKPISSL